MQRRALATERLIVPITRADKRIVERKASAGKMSTAEFVRRAALHYDLGAERQKEEAELRALLGAFEVIDAQTLAQLDRTDAALDATLAYFATKGSR